MDSNLILSKFLRIEIWLFFRSVVFKVICILRTLDISKNMPIKRSLILTTVILTKNMKGWKVGEHLNLMYK